ncbi:hypothetical protein [Streptomyces tsukubensis]|uniref:Uncharacterized protein n=1 Tax=Streptomyces tsukubensis TaxID=83656 RepID=A0A1V4A183_9ACTN|nr:hypothetical protein [Streptomyces tsukubensis]OON72240.1 hypothetical protein B1H18_30475 [Streptomyces tsukubensis]QFR94137.1 hypothetical protein GBW32_15110 [Streptomyces tsukubensis]
MTQSGQGEEPRPSQARRAHEGVVLPADGSDPLPPGTAGIQQPPEVGGTWGQPWGPESARAVGGGQPPRPLPPYEPSSPADVQTQGRHAGGGRHSAAPMPAAGPSSGVQAYEGQPYGGPSYGSGPLDGQNHSGQYHDGRTQDGQNHGGQPYAGQPYSGQPYGGQAYGGQTYGGPEGGPPGYGPADAGGGPRHSQGSGLPAPQGQPQPSPYDQASQPPAAYAQQSQNPYGGPGAQPYQGAGTGPLPPAGQFGGTVSPGVPMPPAAPGGDGDATQFIAPIPAAPGGDGDATQFIAPIPAAPGGDGDATQFIAPIPGGPSPNNPGALPPEAPSDATTFLGRTRPQGAPGSDGDATQYIAPVPAAPPSYGGAPTDDHRPPPAEFDSLFRTERPVRGGPGGPPPETAAPGSTQQLPRVDPDAPAPGGAPAGSFVPGFGDRQSPPDGGGRSAARSGGGRGGRSGSNKLPLIAAVVVGCAVLGLGAGALLSGGDDDDKGHTAPVSATAPADEDGKDKPSPSPSVDPVKEQAVELDKLLGDSNNSRDAVVKSVANIRTCTALGQAATDLRNAAKQRSDLVTRLSRLSVDKLPQQAELKAALTQAWQASASADNHYAAWADQTGRKGGCHKGHARSTGQTGAANKASGTATAAKDKAAGLWNSIASSYGLTQRDKGQL